MQELTVKACFYLTIFEGLIRKNVWDNRETLTWWYCSWDIMDSCVAFYISVVGPIGPCNLVWYPPPVQGVLEVSDERLSAISRVKLEWRQMMALAWSPLALISPAWWIGENSLTLSLSLSLSAYSIFTCLIVFTISHDVNLNCTLARKSAR